MSRAFRYNLILVLVALGTSLAAVAGWRFARASAPVGGPIVLVSIDSLRADRLKAYGGGTTGRQDTSTRVATPALDALAADGVTFDRAYSHVPLTLPAHVSLLSGRLPMDTGVRDNVGANVPDSLRLISSMLADRGYATGGVVSSYALRRETGIGTGFTFFDDELQPPDVNAPAAPGTFPGGLPSTPVVHRDGGESEKRAERWLSGAGTARAFLFLHLDEPHAPYTPPAALAGVGAYEGEIAYADDLVGRLVAYLKKQQLYDESTIIVVGDHGESLGAHGEAQHGLLVFDDTLRVPLIIKRAGAEGRGTRIGELVQHVDIVPTILDLVNAPIPGGLPGRSLRPLLAGTSLGPRVAYGESVFPDTQFGWPVARTVTDGRFRYVSGATPQLFDLEQDPESRTDVSAAHPDDVARLAKALAAFDPSSDEREAKASTTAAASSTTPFVSTVAAADRDRLLSLGFIGPRAFAGRFDAAVLDTPGDAGALVQVWSEVTTAYAERRWTPALEQLRGLLRTSPDRLDWWASLARVAERAQRYELAADAWRHIVTANGTTVSDAAFEARLNLAAMLLRSRRLDDARQQAEAVLELTATTDAGAVNAEAMATARGRAMDVVIRTALARRDFAAARLQATQLAELDATSPAPAFVEGRQLIDRGRVAEALVLLDRAAALAKDRTVIDLEFWRGEALVKLERPSEAEEAYLAELRHVPDSTRAFTSLASLYHTQLRHEEAASLVTHYTQSVRTAEAFEAAGRLLGSFGDRAQAEALKAEALRLFPTSPSPALTQQ